MIRYLFCLLISVFFLECNTSKKDKNKLLIATAASTQFALKELVISFEKKYAVSIDLILGSSGKLTTQILNGAPYDLFFSANMKYPAILFEKGKTIHKPIMYGYGIPVLWTTKEEIKFDSLPSSLIHTNIKHIVVANPHNAPYGEKAIQFFKDYKIYSELENKLVYGENISHVNEYILNKTADFGIGAKSIVLSPKLEGKGCFKELNKKYWIKQGVVIIKNDNLPELKQKFLEYIQSEEGIEILKRFGYSI